MQWESGVRVVYCTGKRNVSRYIEEVEKTLLVVVNCNAYLVLICFVFMSMFKCLDIQVLVRNLGTSQKHLQSAVRSYLASERQASETNTKSDITDK